MLSTHFLDNFWSEEVIWMCGVIYMESDFDLDWIACSVIGWA